MRTYTDTDHAETIMRQRNRHATGDPTVMVDGPDEGQVTLMPLREAIEHGFPYRWAC